MSHCCLSFAPTTSNRTPTTEILEFECIFLTLSTPCFLLKAHPVTDIIYHIVTLGTYFQPLTRIPKSEELTCNQGSIFVPNLPTSYATMASSSLNVDILTVVYCLPILKSSHVLTKYLKSIPMHRIRNTPFHQHSG